LIFLWNKRDRKLKKIKGIFEIKEKKISEGYVF